MDYITQCPLPVNLIKRHSDSCFPANSKSTLFIEHSRVTYPENNVRILDISLSGIKRAFSTLKISFDFITKLLIKYCCAKKMSFS